MTTQTVLIYILYFFFYSAVGWLGESIYCSIGEKKIINCTRYGHGWGKRDNTYDKEAAALIKKTFAK